jgi:probable rRNA maturation factor
MAIHFFTEETQFKLPEKQKRKTWLKELAKSESFKISELNYIFCSDKYLHQMNLDYLKHDTFTDIITFDNSEGEKELAGDIFISIDRVNENAEKHRVDQSTELSRVISHGLFHLAGYKDKKKNEIDLMRAKEEFAIKLFNEI